MDTNIQNKIEIPSYVSMIDVFGVKDKNLELIKKDSPAHISFDGNFISIFGEPKEVDRISKVFYKIIDIVSKKETVSSQDVSLFLRQSKDDSILNECDDDVILRYGKQTIKVKTAGQRKYLNALRNNDIIICSSPAGASKTFTAVTYGISLLREKKIDKIVITRPLVEAGGERVGAEPGTINDKLYNWLLPCLDVFQRVLGEGVVDEYIERGKIQMMPLSRMRGMSYYKSYVLCDEMQNSTPLLAKLAVTRLGEGSKIVIVGDTMQKDRPQDESGLEYLSNSLKEIDGIEVVTMGNEDVVRHPLITKMLNAFNAYDNN